MRLFITADLPESVVGALRDNLADLAKAGIPGRTVARETLHITLAFLGERDEDELDSIVSAMEKAADETCAFEVSLGDYGTFGKGDRGILWQGIFDGTEMENLANCLADSLESALNGASKNDAWKRPKEPFTSHITLARRVDLDKLDIESLEEPWVDSGDVTSITLWQSHLSSEGPTYEALRTVKLSPAYVHPAGRLLLIDADGCPVTREAINCARHVGVPVLLVGNSTQNLEKHLRKDDPRIPKRGFWAATMTVRGGADSADFQIATTVSKGDVVVTQDIGVAAMAIGAGAFAVGVRGREYTKAGIDAALLVRHEEKKVRRLGGRTGGPRAFTEADRKHFEHTLEQVLAREV